MREPKQSWLRTLFGGLLLVLLAYPVFPVLAADSGTAPSWQVTTLDGRKIASDDLKGKVVLVHFWATWCPPCREEMPVLQAFYQRHAKEGLEIVAISLDDDADRSKVKDFTRSDSFPVAMAGEAKVDGFGRVWVLPLSFLIDRKGVVRKSDWTGEEKIDPASLDRLVLPLLAEPRN